MVGRDGGGQWLEVMMGGKWLKGMVGRKCLEVWGRKVTKLCVRNRF